MMLVDLGQRYVRLCSEFMMLVDSSPTYVGNGTRLRVAGGSSSKVC